MNEQELSQRLQAAATPADLERLAADIEAEALEAPSAVVHQWATGDKDESGKAGSVVLDLEELTITPMLNEFDSASLNWRFQFMESAVELLLGFRRRICQQLDALLGSEAAMEGAEAGAGGTRVGDEAYLCIRRMVTIQDGKEQGLSPEADFLRMAPAERSKEIVRFRRSRTWAMLLETDAEPARD